MARFIMILVLGAIITYGVTSITLNEYTSQGTQDSMDDYSYNHARDIANGMIDIVLMRIANDSQYRMTSPQTENLLGGYVSFTAENTFFEGDSLIKIVAAGTYNGVSKTTTAYAKKPDDGWLPKKIRGAWTANGPLDNTISDMYIDGRNYDLSWNLIPNSGTYGVSTSTNFVNTEGAEIGGTEDSVDYPMTFPEVPNVIEENYNWGGTFPTSPDELLGYPEGTLKAYAQSGVNGSQYFDDFDWHDLIWPLSGVTYIEEPYDPNGKEIRLKKDMNHSGILVIHNSDGTSRIKTTNLTGGYFEGIIIGDYMFHFHVDVLGAIMLLSPNLEESQSCSNNKDHKVFYSEAAIKKVTGEIAETLGAPLLYGFGKKRLEVKHWFE